MLIKPIKHNSLGTQVADELRTLIATRRIEAGTTIGEEALAAQFGLSRGPVREAIKTLAGEGLIELGGRSAVIRGLDADDIDELFSLRLILESAAVRMATERDVEQLLAQLDAALDEMEDAVAGGSAKAFAAADLRFHSSLYSVAGHRRLQGIWDLYRPSISVVLLASRSTYDDLRPSIDSHYKLRDLVGSGDLDAVVAELERHLDNARSRVREFYAAGSHDQTSE
ncbi:GntR family transcriptional regulator [Georgenia sp. MJ170]|uniref:GntR family transcriptional regulator n=1 Tax=Georgenia sunbinii TaxID=3117728 RepID=UPI002F267F5B